MKKTGSLFLIFLISVVVLSCEKSPDYSKTPLIRYHSITKYYKPGSSPNIAGRDSIVIAVEFEDGDGDLGITELDARDKKYARPAYGNAQYVPADTVIIPESFEFVGDKKQVFPADTIITAADSIYNHVNFYINEFKKVNGVFVQVDADGSKGGRFKPLYANERKGPIDGLLEHNFVWNHASIFNQGVIGVGDTVRFEVYVLDKNLNESNVVVTDEIVVLVKE